MHELSKDTKILIVGLGLIGGSYADALSHKGYYVGALDIKESSIQFALNAGFISEGQTEVTEEFLKQFDLVIFALYPHVFLEWIKTYQHFLKEGALISDVTGVKASVVYPVQEMLREDLEFIAAHPMAGLEVYGVENASRHIFEDANYIVVPTQKNTRSAIEVCEKLGSELGFARISRLTPERHDEMIGFLSQLTHCIAVSLMTCKDSTHLVDYTGDSFRDLTRIAHINEDMWSELFLLNKEELLRQMDLFAEKFSDLRKSIDEEDADAMKEIMRTSTYYRSFFDK